MPGSPDPVLHVLAGPNGSGKSTLVARVIEPVTHLPFVNADVLAAEHWPGEEAAHGYDAARLAAAERERLIAERRSFIAETVFSHPSKVDLLRTARDAGYRITLHVLLIPEDLAVLRVEDRVTVGGHEVPEEKIRGRYARLWTHVRAAIALADDTIVYDNSRARTPLRPVARFALGRLLGTPTWPAWTPKDLRN